MQMVPCWGIGLGQVGKYVSENNAMAVLHMRVVCDTPQVTLVEYCVYPQILLCWAFRSMHMVVLHSVFVFQVLVCFCVPVLRIDLYGLGDCDAERTKGPI